MPTTGPELPLFRRYPAIRAVPRAELGRFPTAVDKVKLPDERVLFLKRDDRSAEPIGGNKVRGLEWLLGYVGPGDRVLTVGPAGSTHALSTAIYSRALGADATVVRWRQEMNPAAVRCAAKLQRVARVIDARWVALAYGIATSLRVGRGTTWIPAGGAATIALLGHVNAALELAEQVTRGECPEPESVYVPLGTGGTAAGLALGFRIAGLSARVVPVRVVPRIVGRAGRVVSLANAAARFIERITGEKVPRITRDDVCVEHGFYGDAYGRRLDWGGDLTPLQGIGIELDDTYSRKACAAAMASRSRVPMLWLTFDGRLLQD